MKLLIIFSVIGLAVGQAVMSKSVEVNDLRGEQSVLQENLESEETIDERKLDKRSYGWSPWVWPSYGHGIGLSIGHGHGWPSHGWSAGHGLSGWSAGHGLHSGWTLGHGLGGWNSGHGLHGGWSLGWPLYYGGHGGWHSSGHEGWHSKW